MKCYTSKIKSLEILKIKNNSKFCSELGVPWRSWQWRYIPDVLHPRDEH